MIVWKIWSFDYPPVFVTANDLDSAFDKAREINPGYNLAKVVGTMTDGDFVELR